MRCQMEYTIITNSPLSNEVILISEAQFSRFMSPFPVEEQALRVLQHIVRDNDEGSLKENLLSQFSQCILEGLPILYLIFRTRFFQYIYPSNSSAFLSVQGSIRNHHLQNFILLSKRAIEKSIVLQIPKRPLFHPSICLIIDQQFIIYLSMKNLLTCLLLLALGYALNIPRCNAPVVVPFTYINGSADTTTSASLCHDGAFLFVNWTSIDHEVISNYKKCNDPLYKEDVVEIFVSTLDSYPTHYFEIELSPTSQLFFADITNKNGDCSSLGTNYFDCGAMKYRGQKTVKGWEAFLQVGLDVIGRGKAQSKYKINLFRVDYTTGSPTRYLTWQPTFASPPCFHKPAYFQEIILI